MVLVLCIGDLHIVRGRLPVAQEGLGMIAPGFYVFSPHIRLLYLPIGPEHKLQDSVHPALCSRTAPQTCRPSSRRCWCRAKYLRSCVQETFALR